MHWNISEGNIDIVGEHRETEHMHLMTTVDFYKDKIHSLKNNFNHVFKDNRKFDIKYD